MMPIGPVLNDIKVKLGTDDVRLFQASEAQSLLQASPHTKEESQEGIEVQENVPPKETAQDPEAEKHTGIEKPDQEKSPTRFKLALLLVSRLLWIFVVSLVSLNLSSVPRRGANNPRTPSLLPLQYHASQTTFTLSTI